MNIPDILLYGEEFIVIRCPDIDTDLNVKGIVAVCHEAHAHRIIDCVNGFWMRIKAFCVAGLGASRYSV